MRIQEAIVKKRELRRRIKSLLREFEFDTSLVITSVEIERIDISTIGAEDTIDITNISIKCEI